MGNIGEDLLVERDYSSALRMARHMMPESAGKRLSKWVGADPVLETELQGYGWRKGKKTLTPRQVKTIVQFLGEP